MRLLRNLNHKVFNLFYFLLYTAVKLWQQTYVLRKVFANNSCCFYPSCSEYFLDAVKLHGLKGILLWVKRISRCHPLSAGGIDEVQ